MMGKPRLGNPKHGRRSSLWPTMFALFVMLAVVYRGSQTFGRSTSQGGPSAGGAHPADGSASLTSDGLKWVVGLWEPAPPAALGPGSSSSIREAPSSGSRDAASRDEREEEDWEGRWEESGSEEEEQQEEEAVQLEQQEQEAAAMAKLVWPWEPQRQQQQQQQQQYNSGAAVDQPPPQTEQQQQQPGAAEAAEAAPLAAAAAVPASARHPSQPQCAIVNNRNIHLDVAAGMAWAFQEAGCNVTTYLPSNAFGLHEVMGTWFRGRHRPVSTILNDSHLYDAFVLVTYPETHTGLLEDLLSEDLPGRSDLRRRQQRFLAVVHNPHRLLSRRRVARLVRNRALMPAARTDLAALEAVGAEAAAAAGAGSATPPRLQLLTLSPATSTFARWLVEEWAQRTSGAAGLLYVPWVSPLAPWRPSFMPLGADIGLASSEVFEQPGASLQHLCIQGILDPKRRDYAAAFAAVGHPAVLAQLAARNESLLLLGHESKLHPLRMPRQVAGYVRVLSGLPYQEYYDTLSRCRAILPAFASESYLVNKTSSTIATAIHVGSPLLAEERLREAYTFLPAAAMFAFAAPASATPIDVAALAVKASKRYIKQSPKLMAGDGQAGTGTEGAGAEAGDGGEGEAEEAADPSAVAAAAAAQQAANRAAAGQQTAHLRRLQQAEDAAGAGGSELAPSWRQSWRQLAAQLAGAAHPRHRRQQRRSLRGAGDPTPQQPAEQQEQQQQKDQQEEEEQQQGAEFELPPAGSYAAALLRAFEAGAAEQAHAAARRLKGEMMQHNHQVAAHFLEGAAELAARVAAEEAAAMQQLGRRPQRALDELEQVALWDA